MGRIDKLIEKVEKIRKDIQKSRIQGKKSIKGEKVNLKIA